MKNLILKKCLLSFFAECIFVLCLKCLHLDLVFDPLLLVCLAPKLEEIGGTGHLCLLHHDYGTLCLLT